MIAPSGPLDADAFARGLAVLRDELGLEVRMRPDIHARRGYLAGDDARRAEEWREAAADAEARAVFCARGGYGAMRILDRVDPAPMLDPPRWLVGYSDTTALHAALNRAGLVTVHGPSVQQLSVLPTGAKDHLRALLFGRAAAEPARRGLPGPGEGVLGTAVIRPGRASGALLGGSLTLLAHLCGTRWLPSLAGAVLFIEDVDEKPYRLDRYLTQLRLAGALDGLRGVCVGQLTRCDDDARPDRAGADVVRELVRDLGVPAIEGVAAGHERMNLALPLGARATLVAPEPGDPAPPHLVFEAGAAA